MLDATAVDAAEEDLLVGQQLGSQGAGVPVFLDAGTYLIQLLERQVGIERVEAVGLLARGQQGKLHVASRAVLQGPGPREAFHVPEIRPALRAVPGLEHIRPVGHDPGPVKRPDAVLVDGLAVEGSDVFRGQLVHGDLLEVIPGLLQGDDPVEVHLDDVPHHVAALHHGLDLGRRGGRLFPDHDARLRREGLPVRFPEGIGGGATVRHDHDLPLLGQRWT